MGAASEADPWQKVEDLDGTALYRALDVNPTAKSSDIKSAYRLLARTHHPDKGGDPARFASLQHAYETLIDPGRRAVYDAWAKELQFRYVRTAPAAQALGGEDLLLDEFEALGLFCEPASQLVVTCEVCRRPATKECWTCGMPICEFCTLKRHWRGAHPLHWPLVASDHMRERLARRELERKKLEDASRATLQAPHHRSDKELQLLRQFRHDAAAHVADPGHRGRHSPALARFWMWEQTPLHIILAAKLPTGYADRRLAVEADGAGLVLQCEDSPPLVARDWGGSVDPRTPVQVLSTKDHRFAAVVVHKAVPGEEWRRLFRGDSDGLRRLQPPYTLRESDEDVVMEIVLPFWIAPDDVRVEFGDTRLIVDVRNEVHLEREYWSDSKDRQPTLPSECLWSLDEEEINGEDVKILMITLVRPPPSEEEVTWKKGQRQSNRAAPRTDIGGPDPPKGWRFFKDDEDEFGLEAVLQALSFHLQQKAYVPPKPYASDGDEARWAIAAQQLPTDARRLLQALVMGEGTEQEVEA